MVDKTIEIQRNIKQSAESIREYTDDLAQWEEEMSLKDRAASQRVVQSTLQPVRGRVDVATPQQKTSAPPAKGVFKRDNSSMQSYYKAWDTFDPDKYIEEIESEPSVQKPVYKPPVNTAPAKAKVVVKGGRANSSELERMKDQGSLHFTGHDYGKALECYQQCLGMSPDSTVRVVLHSNSSQCLIYMREFHRAEEEASSALSIDPTHVKSLVRRAVANRSLGHFRKSLSDLQSASVLDPSSLQIAQEVAKTTKTRQARIGDIKDAMMSARVSALPTNRITVTNIDSADNPAKEKQQTAPDAGKAKEIALNSVDTANLGSPTSITELEKNCRMLANSPSKLKAYMELIAIEQFAEICAKSTIESDFLMFFIRKMMETIGDQKGRCEALLDCLSRIPRLALVTKFLTKREKAELKEVMDKLEVSVLARSLLVPS